MDQPSPSKNVAALRFDVSRDRRITLSVDARVLPGQRRPRPGALAPCCTRVVSKRLANGEQACENPRIFWPVLNLVRRGGIYRRQSGECRRVSHCPEIRSICPRYHRGRGCPVSSSTAQLVDGGQLDGRQRSPGPGPRGPLCERNRPGTLTRAYQRRLSDQHVHRPAPASRARRDGRGLPRGLALGPCALLSVSGRPGRAVQRVNRPVRVRPCSRSSQRRHVAASGRTRRGDGANRHPRQRGTRGRNGVCGAGVGSGGR